MQPSQPPSEVRDRRGRRRLLAVVAAAAAGALTGCGFALRGSSLVPASVRTVRVTGPAWLVEDLRLFLEPGGTTVLAGGAATSREDVALRLREEGFDRRVLSVDARTGKEREVELAYHLDVDAARGDGTALLRGESIALVRDFALDPDAVIGKSREESVLRREMRRDAAEQVVRRLAAASAG